MSKDQPVTIGTRTFQSQKTAKTFFNVMLNRHALGAPVAETDARELQALVERHPRRDQMTSGGHFEVASGALGARCFRLVRSDGSTFDFSIAECVEHRPTDPRAGLIARFQEAVAPDLEAARARYLAKHLDDDGMVTCGITGNRIMPADGDLTYRAPLTFEAIVTPFLVERPELLQGEPVDAEVVQAFRAHHLKAMRLDFVQRHVRLNKKSKSKSAPNKGTKPGKPTHAGRPARPGPAQPRRPAR